MLLLKHLFAWSFKETEDQVDQSLVLRWFCRLPWQPTPDDTTLIRWAHTLQPETLHRLVERTAELERQAPVTQGRTLRLDATGVQTEIPHPTDSGLLVDSCRVLSRLVQRAKGVLGEQGQNVRQRCRSRLSTARRVAQALHRGLRRKGEDKDAEQKQRYEKLIETTEQMVKQVKTVVERLHQTSEQVAVRPVQQAQQVLPLLEGVIAQTRTRVLEGKKVASEQRVLSLFEPHTRAIPRHKGRSRPRGRRDAGPSVDEVFTPATGQAQAQVGERAQAIEDGAASHVEVALVDQRSTGDAPLQAAPGARHPFASRHMARSQASRWRVERSFAWATRFRRLVRHDEQLPGTLGFPAPGRLCLSHASSMDGLFQSLSRFRNRVIHSLSSIDTGCQPGVLLAAKERVARL